MILEISRNVFIPCSAFAGHMTTVQLGQLKHFTPAIARSDRDTGSLSSSGFSSGLGGRFISLPAFQTSLLPHLPTSWCISKSVTGSEELIKATEAGRFLFLPVCLFSVPTTKTLLAGGHQGKLSPVICSEILTDSFNPSSHLE